MVKLTNVRGQVDIEIDPFMVFDRGVTYTLKAVLTPKVVVDSDGDAVPDKADVCPKLAGDGADGCPIKPTETVVLYVDGKRADAQAVDTANGSDSFGHPRPRSAAGPHAQA